MNVHVILLLLQFGISNSKLFKTLELASQLTPASNKLKETTIWHRGTLFLAYKIIIPHFIKSYHVGKRSSHVLYNLTL